ncbi:MAG: tetratricopeptide repeat protein [Methylocella sp.]
MRHLALAALLNAQLLNANSLAQAEVEGQPSAYYYRALDYAKKGDLGPAIADYGKAIELDPKFAPAYNARSIAYAKKGDPDRAIADFDNAIELDPKYTVAYFNRGLAYGNKGDLDHAIADFGKAIEFDPKFAPAYNARAWTYFKRRRKGCQTLKSPSSCSQMILERLIRAVTSLRR